MRNYCPVSNLSYLSTIIEEGLNDKLQDILTGTLLMKLFDPLINSHSTKTALIYVFDNILTRLDKQNKTHLIAMLDMSTAFDTVEHVILLKRLNMTFEITSKAMAVV